MQSIRRAALRSASSATRAVSSKALPTPFASSISRNVEASRIVSICAARFFSQTSRFQNSEQDTLGQALESTEGAPAPSSQTTPPATPYGAFVRNIMFEANEEHLYGLFEKFGGISHINVVKDSRGMSKGFGFVYFDNADSLKEACANTNGSFWHGRRITCIPKIAKEPGGRRASKGPSEPSAQLFIGNIPYETADADLNAIFSGLMNLKDVRIAVDRATGWPRGFAHADFADVQSATIAHDKLQNVQLGGRNLFVDYAAPKEERRHHRAGRGDREDLQTSNDDHSAA
ncbi:hypothetical protein B0T19DRAFT_406958 [Cercophora scortea]|uniref:RRM domain-containing protein n=1 Tax=Cercophora scortea TaxID=314031 RepID=A0AAE0J296_9PEZI|nr:hypothetical protein B0T19DRAFT_406958 [Cercophora scortea]